MKTGICHIVGAAPISENELAALQNEPIKDGDLWIAADGGAFALAKAGKSPDILMGDFDSAAEYRQTEENGIVTLVEQWLQNLPCEHFPKEKDETDLYLAYQKGIAMGYTHFCFWGAYGGRPDHTLANYQMLTMLATKGHFGVIVADGWKMTAVHNGRLNIQDVPKGSYVSVFSLTDISEEVTLTGLYYPLDHKTLYSNFALGVSNEALGDPINIEVNNGTLLVMWQC